MDREGPDFSRAIQLTQNETRFSARGDLDR